MKAKATGEVTDIDLYEKLGSVLKHTPLREAGERLREELRGVKKIRITNPDLFWRLPLTSKWILAPIVVELGDDPELIERLVTSALPSPENRWILGALLNPTPLTQKSAEAICRFILPPKSTEEAYWLGVLIGREDLPTELRERIKRTLEKELASPSPFETDDEAHLTRLGYLAELLGAV